MKPENDTPLTEEQAKALDHALAKPPSRPTIIAHRPMPRPKRMTPLEVALLFAISTPSQPKVKEN